MQYNNHVDLQHLVDVAVTLAVQHLADATVAIAVIHAATTAVVKNVAGGNSGKTNAVATKVVTVATNK